LFALNVPDTLRLLLTVVAPPYTVSPFDNTDAPMTFRSFERLTVLLNDAKPDTYDVPDTMAFPNTARPFENVPVPLTYEVPTTIAFPDRFSPFDNTDAPMTFRSFERLTVLLNDDRLKTVRPFDKIDLPSTFSDPDVYVLLLSDVVPP
jgi:hypothetical protein